MNETVRATPASAMQRFAPIGSGLGPVWLGLYAAILAGWAALWAMDPARSLPEGASGLEAIRSFCAAAARDASLPGLWAMWAVMGAAMMLPTALPALGDYAGIATTAHARGAEARPRLALTGLAAGYLAVWAGVAGLAAGLQAGLAEAGAMLPGGQRSGGEATALLLLAAGLWQFSPLKEACLSRCRSPMALFLARWRPGPRAAFATGVRMGADCVGCCWALMALALVGGLDNLVWMGAATLLMTLEKLPEIGRPLTRPLGWTLLGAAVIVALATLTEALGGPAIPWEDA